MPLPPGFLETARALIRADTSPGQGTRAAASLLTPLYEATLGIYLIVRGFRPSPITREI